MLAAPFGLTRNRRLTLGAVAQLVERLLCKEKVRSSNLLGSTEPRVSGGKRFLLARRIIGGPPARIPTYGEEVSPRTTSFLRQLSVRARTRPRAVHERER